MKSSDIEVFEKVQAQLHGLYDEMTVFAKKTPDGPVNKFKLKFINQVLNETNGILTGKNKPFTDFDQFDEDLLPTNSDVIVILSQYINCLEKYRSENINRSGSGYWYWIIDGKESNIRTSPPKKLNY